VEKSPTTLLHPRLLVDLSVCTRASAESGAEDWRLEQLVSANMLADSSVVTLPVMFADDAIRVVDPARAREIVSLILHSNQPNARAEMDHATATAGSLRMALQKALRRLRPPAGHAAAADSGVSAGPLPELRALPVEVHAADGDVFWTGDGRNAGLPFRHLAEVKTSHGFVVASACHAPAPAVRQLAHSDSELEAQLIDQLDASDLIFCMDQGVSDALRWFAVASGRQPPDTRVLPAGSPTPGRSNQALVDARAAYVQRELLTLLEAKRVPP
jgi:hypothetical protein